MKIKLTVLTAIISILVILSLTACSSNNTSRGKNNAQPTTSVTTYSEPADQDTPQNESDTNKGQTADNLLIAYFTMPEGSGVDAVASASRVEVAGEILGSTQFIAQEIQKATSGDLFAIETVQEYPDNHDELVDFADGEQSEEARPELSIKVENIEDYDGYILYYN